MACSTHNSCAVFDSIFSDPRPPEQLQETPNELNTPILHPDTSSFLIQMFLSDLQDGSTSASPDSSELGDNDSPTVFEKDVELESKSDMSRSDSPSVPSSAGSPLALECLPTDTFFDQMDDPFLSNFTDISLLRATNNCTSQDQVSPLFSAPPSSPIDNDVKIRVIDSSECDVSVCNQETYNVSDCLNYFTTSISSPSSPSVSTSSSSSPTTSTPFQLDDIDFSAISDQELASIVSSVSTTEQDSATPVIRVTTTTTRKRKAVKKNSKEMQARKSPKASPTSSRSTRELGIKEKQWIRREKNNKASVISRAKRRQRCKNSQSRVEELTVENDKLRAQVEEMTVEAERLRKLLLSKLSK